MTTDQPRDESATAHTCGNCEGVDPETCLMNPDRREPDNETATALARHIASHPVGDVQAAYRLLGMELAFEVRDDTTAPGGDGQAAASEADGSGDRELAVPASDEPADFERRIRFQLVQRGVPEGHADWYLKGFRADVLRETEAAANAGAGSLRERVAAALQRAHREWMRPGSDAGQHLMVDCLADAVLAVVHTGTDTGPAGEVAAVRAELDRIAELPTVTCDDGRADRFSTGARWTLRMIREVLNGQEHTP